MGHCAAPQLVELSRLVLGMPHQGVSLPAFPLRLNQSVCGTPAFWFVQKPDAPPEAKEVPASA
jgi:hypothetical protein